MRTPRNGRSLCARLNWCARRDLTPGCVILPRHPPCSRPQLRGSIWCGLGLPVMGSSRFVERIPPAELGLHPAMTLRGRVIAVHRLPAGVGVSYNHTWRPDRETTVALIPFGYADGLPRQASNRGEVWLAGGRRPVVGRIGMDQCVVDVGNAPVAAGDEVVLFGDPSTGVPSAEDWAVAAGTIGYDIVTRIGPRVPRRALGVT